MPQANGVTNMNETQIEAYEDELQQGCHAYDPMYTPSYGYVPSLAAGIIFCIFFGIPLLWHTFHSCRTRKTTSILLALGALTEAIGWGARAYSANCPYNSDAFLAQEVTLIIAPVFFSAALYVLLGQFIIILGKESSILSAKWYTIVFCTCDVVSLVVQAIGGAQASSSNSGSDENLGTHIMVAGIAFQLFTMTLFGLLLGDFAWRVGGRRRGLQDAVTRGMKLVSLAVLISFIMIYIRSVYRLIELVQGWHGYLITHEGYFIGLDAAIMVVAVAVFVPLDPALLMNNKNKYVRSKQSTVTDSSDAEAVAMGSYEQRQTAYNGGAAARY